MDAADQRVQGRGHGRRATVPPARGRRKKPVPARANGTRAGRGRMIRALAVTAGLAVLAFGFQGPTVAGGIPASVRTGSTQDGSQSQAEAAVVLAADSRALLSYSRSNVRTVSKNGKGRLNLASAALQRPPAGSLMAPLEVLAPSSPFGLRTSPITGAAGEFHWGQDYSSPCGTRVYSADAGVVRAVGWHQWGGGNRVEIDHGNGLITTYNHLEAIAVTQGDSVEVGQIIARAGTTGSSTGCHLHFETILNGAHANPSGWTLLPIRQLDELGTIPMVSYAPTDGKPAAETPRWALPVTAEYSHDIDGTHEHPTHTPVPADTGASTADPSTAPTDPAPAPLPRPAPRPARTTPAPPSPSQPSHSTGTPPESSPAQKPSPAPSTPPAGDNPPTTPAPTQSEPGP